MDKAQYRELTNLTPVPTFMRGDMLKDQTNRTLIYGYTCDRETFHLYLQRGEIKLLIYKPTFQDSTRYLTISGPFNSLEPQDCVPNKRIYPEACDFEFCTLLRQYGVELPFTTWDDKDPPLWNPNGNAYHGIVR